MTAESTLSARKRQAPKKPAKPRKDFPLFPHASGRWAKKVRGKFAYFGKVADDPKGSKALELWLEQKDDLLAGRKPRVKTEGLTVKDLCNRFLTAKDHQLATGEITNRTRIDYQRTTDRLIAQFGRERLVEDLASDDFEQLRASIAKTCGSTTIGNEVTRVRVVFSYAYEAGLIERPMRYGPTFKRPAKKLIRRERNEKGARMFTVDEVKALLAVASPQLKAMILLGLNCGFGNHDVGTLPESAVDLENGWIDFPRPKTEIHRRCSLWPETVDAMKAAMEDRPEPKDGAQGLVFVTKYGGPWAKDVFDSPVTKETRKLLDGLNAYKCKCNTTTIAFEPDDEEELKCPECDKVLGEPEKKGIHRPGLGFYALRHTFRTIADETRDFPAIDHIMGHSRNDMASVYRERIGDDRLKAVSDHVHAWLFGDAKKLEGASNG